MIRPGSIAHLRCYEIIHKLEDGFIEINVKTKEKKMWRENDPWHPFSTPSSMEGDYQKAGREGRGIRYLADAMAENIIVMEAIFK